MDIDVQVYVTSMSTLWVLCTDIFSAVFIVRKERNCICRCNGVKKWNEHHHFFFFLWIVGNFASLLLGSLLPIFWKDKWAGGVSVSFSLPLSDNHEDVARTHGHWEWEKQEIQSSKIHQQLEFSNKDFILFATHTTVVNALKIESQRGRSQFAWIFERQLIRIAQISVSPAGLH